MFCQKSDDRPTNYWKTVCLYYVVHERIATTINESLPMIGASILFQNRPQDNMK